MFSKVVKPSTSCKSPLSAFAISSNVDKTPAADLHVARERIDATQAKIDRLTRELEIEQVRRREAEAMCQVVAAKLHSQRQTISSLTEENFELHSRLTSINAERDELMRSMKELVFDRALLANHLQADEEEVASSCEFFDDDSDDKSIDSNMSLCSHLDTVSDSESAFSSMPSMDFSDISLSFDLDSDIVSGSPSFTPLGSSIGIVGCDTQEAIRLSKPESGTAPDVSRLFDSDINTGMLSSLLSSSPSFTAMGIVSCSDFEDTPCCDTNVSLYDLHNGVFTSTSLLSPSASFLALTSAPCSGLDPTTSSFFLSVNKADNELPRVFPSFDLDLDSGMFSTLLSSSPSFTAMATAPCSNAEDTVTSRDVSESFEIDTSICDTLPMLLSSSTSFTALSGSIPSSALSLSKDEADITVTLSNISQYPSLLSSSPSFTTLALVDIPDN